MSGEEYVQNAIRTEMSFQDYHYVASRLADVRVARLLHAILGFVTETGELADVLKKHLIYGKPIDWTNVVEELGDKQWYTALASDVCGELVPGATWDGILVLNIQKLKHRYGEKFTTEKALNRDLEGERKVLEKAGDCDLEIQDRERLGVH
jgi:NTP pyrophosphatase (non-canonical NTP hydrolase)